MARMRFQDLVAGERSLQAIKQWTQPLKNARLPVNQRAVTVETQRIKIGQFHSPSSSSMIETTVY